MTDFKALSLNGTCNIFAYIAGQLLNTPVHLVIHLNENFDSEPDDFVPGQVIAHAVCEDIHNNLFDANGYLGINTQDKNWQDALKNNIIERYYTWDEPYCLETDPLDVVTMSADQLKELSIHNPESYCLNSPTVLTKDEFEAYQNWIQEQLNRKNIS